MDEEEIIDLTYLGHLSIIVHLIYCMCLVLVCPDILYCSSQTCVHYGSAVCMQCILATSDGYQLVLNENRTHCLSEFFNVKRLTYVY